MSIALIAFIYPWSESKGERIQSLLTSALPYYHSPSSLCTTWAYATPATRPKAPSQQLTTHKPSSKPLLLAGIEIYSSPKALDHHLSQPWFKAYQKATVDENLYAHPEEMQVWKPVGGFVSREKRAKDESGGKTVMLARFECKDAGDAKRKVVEELSKFAAWVQQNEPKTLTYAVLARPDGKKDSHQVIMFERYTGPDAVAEHGGRKEFKAMFKQIAAHIHVKQTKIAEFVEIAGSFVGSEVGAEGEGGTVELPPPPAKL